jgi:hypothetical protein
MDDLKKKYQEAVPGICWICNEPAAEGILFNRPARGIVTAISWCKKCFYAIPAKD